MIVAVNNILLQKHSQVSKLNLFGRVIMNVSLSKFTYILREDGTLRITYGLFPEYLYNDLMDSIGEEPAIFLFNLIF